jgi:hypothetical protein
MRRSTIVFIVLFAVILGVYFYLNNKPAEPTGEIALTLEPIEEVSYLFAAEDGNPTGIRIESKAGEVVEVARNAENAWALILPEKTEADQASAEAAASQITTIRIMDHIPASVSPKDVGLEVPEYTITITFDGNVKRIAVIGVLTPSESGYYARVADEEIVIVSRSGIDSLIEMITNPPYAPTEAPTPVSP